VEARKEQEAISLEGGGEYVSIMFSGNDACVSSYKRILCMYNFPRCSHSSASDGNDNSTTGDEISGTETFGLCRAMCEDYFASCRFDSAGVAGVCRAAGSTWPGTDVPLADSEQCTGSGAGSVTAFMASIILVYVYPIH
jgi:hypothetical protein